MRNGVEFYDDQDKLTIATDFFTDIFGTPSVSLPTLDVSHLYDQSSLSMLEEPFSWGEIVSVINGLPSNRSPGPDGYTNEFFLGIQTSLEG